MGTGLRDLAAPALLSLSIPSSDHNHEPDLYGGLNNYESSFWGFLIISIVTKAPIPGYHKQEHCSIDATSPGFVDTNTMCVIGCTLGSRAL